MVDDRLVTHSAPGSSWWSSRWTGMLNMLYGAGAYGSWGNVLGGLSVKRLLRLGVELVKKRVSFDVF